MLVNLKEILEPAREQQYAVGHFNTLNVEMARAVIRAAEEAGAPVILGIEERQLDICPIDEFAAFSVAMAKKARVDVAVHFDRGRTFEKCIEAMKLGFTSVNYDCSELSMEENAEKVAELVRVAHAYGASVEAELGHVPEAINLSEEEKKDYHTTPDQAKRYVEMTGVDALAIAVGTAQGQYTFTPKVDFDRIRAISEATQLPLTLHGGSGLSENHFRKAIDNGISKINIFTDLNIAGGQGAIFAINSGFNQMPEIIQYEVYSMKVQALEKIRLFRNGK